MSVIHSRPIEPAPALWAAMMEICGRQKVQRVLAESAAYSRKRKKRIRQATVAWANEAAIAAVYDMARRVSDLTGIDHHVDHDFPLFGRFVSGLHVETNLRIMPATENMRRPRIFQPI